MGRQINFYLHPDDYCDFEDMLKKSGDVLFLPYFHFDKSVRIIPKTIPLDIKKEGSRVYVVRQSDIGQIETHSIEKFGYWLIADNNAPVLHYDRCSFSADTIHRGRLYFEPKFVRNMEWVSKPIDFINWSDNIIKNARRLLTRYRFDMDGWYFSEYVGKHAKAWLDETKLERQTNDSKRISGY